MMVNPPCDSRTFGTIVRVGDGDLDVTVGFGNRNDEVGDLGRVFNHMVQQLYGRQKR